MDIYAIKKPSAHGDRCLLLTVIEDLSGEGNNELNIEWKGNSSIAMTVQNQRVFLTPCCGYNMSDLVFGWRKYCFTYKSGEIVKVIYDITLTVACYA